MSRKWAVGIKIELTAFFVGEYRADITIGGLFEI